MTSMNRSFWTPGILSYNFKEVWESAKKKDNFCLIDFFKKLLESIFIPCKCISNTHMCILLCFEYKNQKKT